MKNGFTLVELSIVLVIIGLLIGGILVGQSLVNSVKLSRTIADIAKFDAAVLIYKSQYKYLPGDNPNEVPADVLVWGSCTPANGLGNGFIDGGCFVGQNVAGHYYGGLRQFWYIVSGRTFQPGYTNTGHLTRFATSAPDQTAYPAPIASGKNTGFWAGCLGSGNNCNQSSKANYYAITVVKYDGNRTRVHAEGAVVPIDAFALDKKADDGIANTGNIVAGNTPQGVSRTTLSANCSVGGDYTITQTGYECIPVIRIGAQVGNLM